MNLPESLKRSSAPRSSSSVGDDVEQLLERQARTFLARQGLEGERLRLFSQFPFQSDDDQRVVVDSDRGT